MSKRVWRVSGRADATFYVLAETEREALNKAQEGDCLAIKFDNEESFYEEAFQVDED